MTWIGLIKEMMKETVFKEEDWRDTRNAGCDKISVPLFSKQMQDRNSISRYMPNKHSCHTRLHSLDLAVKSHYTLLVREEKTTTTTTSYDE